MFPLLFMLGLLFASRRVSSSSGPTHVYDPKTGDRTPLGPPGGGESPPLALPPGTPGPGPAVTNQPNPGEPPTMVPQPKGASGNLPDVTRPIAREGFNPEAAHRLAPQVAEAVRKSGPATLPIVRLFQIAADIWPRDGIYGPRTAGALAYYLARPGQPTPKTPAPHTRDKRIIQYRI